MRGALAVVLLLGLALPTSAYELCSDREKRKAFDRESRAVRKALPERRFADLERHFGGLLARLDRGEVGDAYVDRAFWVFGVRSLGDCAGCGSRDPEPLLREWARQHPRSAAAHIARSYHQIAVGAWGEAARSLSEADSIGQGRAVVSAQRIRVAARDVRSAGGASAELFRKAIAAHPMAVTARVRFAEASQPRHGGSIAQIESVVGGARGLPKADERFVRYAAFQTMGAAAEAGGDNALAIRHYQESAPFCPGLYNASARLAALYQRTGRHLEAVKAATSIVEIDRTDGWARTLRGRSLRALGRHPEAISDFESAIELGYAPAFGDLGWYYETGTAVPRDLRRARELYTIGAYDENPAAREGLARLRENGV